MGGTYYSRARPVHSGRGSRGVRMAYPSLPRAIAGGVLLALVAGGLFFQDLGRYPLWDPDEARHAEIAREMAAAHGWRRLVLPTLELAPYREKPPGHYWLVSLAYTALGVDAGAARTPSAVAAWLLVMTLYAWTLPRAGVAGALGAGLVAATSAGWLGLARYANLDMTFTACVTLGVLAGLAWLERPPPRRPPFVPYVAAAAGTLVKGPLAVLLVAGPLGLAALTRRPRPTWRELGFARGIAAGGAIVALAAAAAAVAARSYPVPALGRAAFATAALAWALALAASVLTGNRQHAVPLALLGAVVTLHPVFVRFAAPAVSALHSDHAMAQVLAQAGPAPVIAFGSQAPSLVFYLGTPVVHTEDPRLVRDLFEADAAAFVVTGRRHVAELEALLGPRGRLWYATPRRRLYANQPPR